MTTKKTWAEMTEADREAFKQTLAYHDPTNPARVPWGEWSDAAVGRVFRAHQSGKQIDRWWIGAWKKTSQIQPHTAIYRIPPEPKRETVRLVGWLYGGTAWTFEDAGRFPKSWYDYTLNIPTIDGKPDLTKCPHCGTAPIDMEALE